MKHSQRDTTLALAGIFQSASLVKQIANTGSANDAILEATLETLFRFDASDVESVYGGIAGVGAGIRGLCEQLTAGREKRDIDITRYVITMITLERKLSGNPQMLETIGAKLKEIQENMQYFSLMHDNTILKIGQLYRDTVSQLKPRIMVSGSQPYLGNEHNASKVRAVLMAGMRSAILWRQCGGTKWSILFGRKRYESECNNLLREL